jgi:NAD(P)-dependent dehydrogenase (short-subunit alcohol dehydrogenase family)
MLEDKVVVIAGVGSGLGRSIAVAALRDGACVLLGARTASRLQDIASELDPSGERVARHPLDIAERSRCEEFAAAARERFGRIDALVQCAALDDFFGGIRDTSPDDWRPTFDVNFFGSMQLVQACLPHMSNGGGSIVFIGAQAMYWPQVNQLGYAASKAALSTGMLFLAKELGASAIRVNTVVPTWIWGAAVEGYIQHSAAEQGVPEQELIDEITAGMAIPEIPTEADVANAVVFLCSDRARMITGQSLLVNAGEMFR